MTDRPQHRHSQDYDRPGEVTDAVSTEEESGSHEKAADVGRASVLRRSERSGPDDAEGEGEGDERQRDQTRQDQSQDRGAEGPRADR